MGDSWYATLTKPTSIDKTQLEQSIGSLPPEIQAKIRALSAPAPVESQPATITDEERQSQLLARCLDGLKHDNLITMMKEIKAGNVRMDQQDESGNPLLHIAISRSEVMVVKELLEVCPVDLRNEKGQTALSIAVAQGSLPMIKLLLDRGADIEAKDQFHYSLLHTAVQNNHLLAFLCLLERGANPDSLDVNGSSLVHWAAYKNDLEFLRMLKGLKQQMNRRNSLGLTPLHTACQGNAAEAYWFLVGEGLDPDELSKDQSTPLEVLRQHHGRAGVDRLIKVGAKRNLNIACFSGYYLLGLLLCCYYYYSSVVMCTAQFLLPSLILNLGFIFLPILFMSLRKGDSFEAILNAVREMFEAEKFLEIAQMEKICFTCNAMRGQRSRHCRFSHVCIPKFDHYCRELDLCVGANNRKHFVLTLTLHTAVISCYLLLEFLGYCVKTDEGHFTKKFVLVFYAVFADAPIHLFFLLVCGLVWWYSIWYCFVELSSISQGLTVFEAMNRHRCRYLFSACTGLDEVPRLRYKNPFHQGIFRNWVDFLASE